MDKGKEIYTGPSSPEEGELSDKLLNMSIGYEEDIETENSGNMLEPSTNLKPRGKKIPPKRIIKHRRRAAIKRSLELSLADIQQKLDECETFTPMNPPVIAEPVLNQNEWNPLSIEQLMQPPPVLPMQPEQPIPEQPMLDQAQPEFWWTNDWHFQALMNAPIGPAPWPYQEPEPNPHWPQVNPEDLAEVSRFADELIGTGHRLTHMGETLAWKFPGNQFPGGQF